MIGRLLLSVLPKRCSIALLTQRELKAGELELARIKHLNGSGLFIDVGANRGIYARVAREVGFHVLAFEPNPRLARYIRAWSPPAIEIREELVSSAEGFASIAIPLNSRGSEEDGLASVDMQRIGRQHEHVREIRVPCVSLDSLELKEVAFIKIDVEGHELDVLRGAVATLQRCNPMVQVEIEERHRNGGVESCRALFEGLGYKGYFVKEKTVRDISSLSLAEDQDLKNVGNRARYVNNFYFMSDDSQLDWLRMAAAADK